MTNPMPFNENGFGDPFASVGGITYHLDSLLHALEDATKREDAWEYVSLASQLAVILAPKLSAEEFKKLSNPEFVEPSPGMTKRSMRREYERRMFAAARENVAEMLRIISARGIYAKPDQSKPEVQDGTGLALK